MNKQLIFIYEPNGLQAARMKISRHQTALIQTNSFDYFGLNDFDGYSFLPELIILEDEAVYQVELIEAALNIPEIETILVCDNLGVMSGVIEKIQQAPLIVTLDYKIGSNNSTENLPAIYIRLRERFKTTAVIGYTNFGRKKSDKQFSARNADELTDMIRSNNDSVIEKTGMNSKAMSSILYDRVQVQLLRKKVMYLNAENTQLKKENSMQEDFFADKIRAYKDSILMRTLDRPLIGDSLAIRKIKFFIEKYADSGLEVLIMGESGTGKELVAQALHKLSDRREKSFIPVDCGAFNTGTVESDLFGHEEGAYTGATKKHIGYIEQANNGTLFLDEIGNLPYDLQVKLLRVLQEKEIQRMSGQKRIPVDFRLICATNKNLKQLVAEGKFHEDLLQRIVSIFPNMPPLRQRKDDIPVLVKYFCKKHGLKFEVNTEIMDFLKAYHWPGNIRELEKFISHLKPFFKDVSPELKEVKWLLESQMVESDEKEMLDNQETLQFLDQINTILGTNTKFVSVRKIKLEELADELGISRNSFFEQRRKHTKDINILMAKYPKRWPAIRNKNIKLPVKS